jgi:squalene-hopene/tetraprenyl-beta-curcumene cyclase
MSRLSSVRATLIVFAVLSLAVVDQAWSQSVTTGDDAVAYQQAVDRAIGFLKTQAQAPDGSYFAKGGPGVTALVTYSILKHGRTPDDPLVAKSLKYLEGFVQPDGGVYQEGGYYPNYETCLAIMCLTEANGDHRYDKQIAAAEKFVKAAQWEDGGAGYGKHKRADLSNTGFLIDALRAAGRGPDDEAMKRALAFVSRCQNLESSYNNTEFAAKVNDGGFYYTYQAGGVSFADKTPNGGLRSYGSMTYAGLKSMLYAGVGPDDPRVKAAVKWIQQNFDLQINPGMGKQGLFYYYHVFAKALHALGQDTIEDARGVKHDWRRELRSQLLATQRPDGSWVNTENRWLEGEPALVTAYALMSLAYCRK